MRRDKFHAGGISDSGIVVKEGTAAFATQVVYFVIFALNGAEELTDAFGGRPEATQTGNRPLLPA